MGERKDLGAISDQIFEGFKAAGKGVATVYLGPGGGQAVDMLATTAKQKVDTAYGHNPRAGKHSVDALSIPGVSPAAKAGPPASAPGKSKKKAKPKAKLRYTVPQPPRVEVRVDADPEEIFMTREADNTGAIVLPRRTIGLVTQPYAVLPGKPNPLDYGALRTTSGKYVWPPGLPPKGLIKVHGKLIRRTTAIANYKKALTAWSARNIVYREQVARRGGDTAARAALRAQASRAAALETRISDLEMELQSAGQQPTAWSEDDAFYNQPESYEEGEYFDDNGEFGVFDGMSGADGDLGYVRRYGRSPQGYGRRFAPQYRPSTYYAQEYVNADPMYGMYIDDFLMGADDMSGDDVGEGVEGNDDVGDVDGIEVDTTSGVDDMGNADDVGEAGHPDPYSHGTSGADDMGARRPAGMPRSIPMPGARPGTAPHRPPAPRHRPPAPIRRIVPDHRDAVISQLHSQLQQGKIDTRVLAETMKQAGYIIGTDLHKKEHALMARRRTDGLAGSQNVPPPPPAPSGLSGASESRDDDDYPSGVGLSGASNGAPPPPPAPTQDELSGTECLPCQGLSQNDQ